MKVILFGASGMVGQAAMRACLEAPDVETVLSVGRSGSGVTHPKVKELVRKDLFDYAGLDAELSGYDACFFCLGVTSAGMSEADYTRVTYDLTMAAASTLARLNPQMTFLFVSGTNTDSTEKGPTMWARVKGRAENGVFSLPFKASFAIRPSAIQPMHGIKSRTASYRVLYTLLAPFFPLIRWLAPNQVTNTDKLGRAMLQVARHGAPKRILETRDINAMGA